MARTTKAPAKKKKIRKTGKRPVQPSGPKGGRPRLDLDWGVIDMLCAAQCTGEEIAAHLGIDYDTLQSHCLKEQGVGYSEYFAVKRLKGFVSLRAKRWQRALAGDTTLIIYLSKALFHESDRHDIRLSGPNGGPIEQVIEMTLEKGDGTELVINPAPTAGDD